jgi:general stress protein 26
MTEQRHGAVDETSGDEEAERIWDRIEKIDTAMLVTHGKKGLHARPMAPIVRRLDGAIWFLTDDGGSKNDELAANKDVALTFSKGATQVAMAGEAEVCDGRATIRDLWNPGAQAWYPQGPEDPSIQAICVRPTIAELWDGPSKPVALVQMAIAHVTGRSADGTGENIKTEALANPA